jgi:hypothetical protein
VKHAIPAVAVGNVVEQFVGLAYFRTGAELACAATLLKYIFWVSSKKPCYFGYSNYLYVFCYFDK